MGVIIYRKSGCSGPLCDSPGLADWSYFKDYKRLVLCRVASRPPQQVGSILVFEQNIVFHSVNNKYYIT